MLRSIETSRASVRTGSLWCAYCSLVLVVMSCLPLPRLESQTRVSSGCPILSYRLDGIIHGGTVAIIDDLLKAADRAPACAVLIELDTPGGLLDSTERIVKRILNTTVPVIVYVAPRGARAGSAGTFITLAAHVAAMAPGTYIGAAHPVMVGDTPTGEQKSVMDKKIESAMASFIEAIAKERGRNAQWARKAVLESASLTAVQALEKNVVDFLADNRESLLQAVDMRRIVVKGAPETLHTDGAQWVAYRPALKLRALNALASPTVIYFLILVIIAGLYLEFSHPGLILPGAAAGVCLFLVLVATSVLPITVLGISLMLMALVLLVLEIFIASYGLLTIGATAAFFMGSLLLFDNGASGITVPLSYIIGSSAALAVIAVTVGIFVVHGLRRKQQVGKESLVGEIGYVEDPIPKDGIGRVLIKGEYWNATALQTIASGRPVRVSQVNGLLLVVMPVS